MQGKCDINGAAEIKILNNPGNITDSCLLNAEIIYPTKNNGNTREEFRPVLYRIVEGIII